MNTIITAIRRYPVRGLSGQDLPSVTLTAGQALPFDRRYGLLTGPAAQDADRQGWRPTDDFFTLDRAEKLALLESEFDADTSGLVIRRAGKPVSRGRLDQAMGCMLVEQFFAAYLAGAAPGLPKLVDAGPGGAFPLHEDAPVLLLNLASVRDLEERVAKQPVDPNRFRANLHFDGFEPWVERQWVGRTLTVGGARLQVVRGCDYRPGSDVNPVTGTRDLTLLPILERGYGNSQCGIAARVVTGGMVAPGDAVLLD
ncbi:MOSC domain-containing protein [Azospirillum thermophilum]|uniref:MOSC domain-containing protein n=1 Tax=Azospirillum thermophilum TaxID=2202148 RepID=A0A2S2CPH3_9PROT|nr:MOSC domain-containing protein [Azospirillum thermophilum]AWK86217.1 MOSC domain-containing protein [Azospirillum thermophilum]